MAEINPTPITKTSWDEMNCGIFLQLLVDEINAGNRPSGQFTKQAWGTITNKFKDLSGCNFSQAQLKNKWDNLKKDFALWEKLLHEESGLGYDYCSGRVIAEPSWWRQKIQERPEYKKFRTHGPVHLELQERVFRRQVATGYMEYIPETMPARNDDEPGEVDPIDTDNVPANLVDDSGMPDETLGVPPTRTAGRGGHSAVKRKRSRSTSKNTSFSDVNANMYQLINKWHQQAESSSSVQTMVANKELSYDEALDMLSSLPWIDEDSQEYMDAMVLLEDPNKRVALRHIKDKSEQFVKRWIRKLQEEKDRRIF